MRFFNISTQVENIKDIENAIKNEYLSLLKIDIESLYEYIHYYNPEWRLLTENTTFFRYNRDYIDEVNIDNIIENNKKLKIDRLNFRWGFKNTTSQQLQCGNSDMWLNIGASVYKIDPYDVNIEDADLMSHYIIFEGALGQYYLWDFNFVMDGADAKLKYYFFLADETVASLSFKTQFAVEVPRYFYRGTYDIKYLYDADDLDELYDYVNHVSDTLQEWQQWENSTSLMFDVVYKYTDNDNNIKYEEIIADTLIHEGYSTKGGAYKVFLDKTEQSSESIEENFEVIFH